MYAIRRNLRKGKQFGWMQIHEAATKSAIKKGSNDIFVDPSKFSIKMQNCYIHNSVARSAKIHSGDIHKERCAWVACSSFEIVKRVDAVDGEVSFNPRIAPNFMHNGVNVDKQTFTNLITFGTQIFTNSNSK
jgi:hypothetical protein